MVEKRVFTPVGLDELLTGWLIHTHKARDRHDEAARRYAKGQYALGIPSLIVSTIVGTSVFAALSSKEVPPLWVGLLSILAAVLAALQTFLDFVGRSDKQRSAAMVQLKRGAEPTKDDIAAIRTMLDGLEETAPVVMPKIFDAIEKKYLNMEYVSNAISLYNKV